MTTGTQSCQNTSCTFHTRPEEWRDTWASLPSLLGLLLPQAPHLSLPCAAFSSPQPTSQLLHPTGVGSHHPYPPWQLHPSRADPGALVSSFCLLHYPRLWYSLLLAHTHTLTFPSSIFLSLKLDNFNVFMLIAFE